VPIDDCQHSFRTLSKRVLPGYMREMRRAMTLAMPLTSFDTPGVGLCSVMRILGLAKDFSGCYVLIKRRKPVYVGISRRVMHRLYSHVRGKTQFRATLAFKMAAVEMDLNLTRREKMRHEDFRLRFSYKQSEVKKWHVDWIQIENPLELHLFEVFCAMELNTSKWNTFRTH
jgi:hypothetical protein